ncbi:MAG: hypothetical protein JWO10_874, partial [Microbacteriaceae bacterium]|nr:hypothetical protein [Microbacteriaceae bacterium]
SFSSGLGLDEQVKGSPDFCHRSEQNFPHRVAKALGMKLTDVTCGGATSADVISTPMKYGSESTPVQIEALSRKTDVVTITIGGNDLGFVDIARSCIALKAAGPLLLAQAPNCKTTYTSNGVDQLVERLNGPVLGQPSGTSGLTATFAEIRRAAPNAKVFVVGYPTIMPDAANTPASGCFALRLTGTNINNIYADNVFPFTTVDAAYFNSLQNTLNDLERGAAKKAGFTFVSMLAATAANSACAPTADRYVNAVSLLRDADNALQLDLGSLHPNATGAAFLAASVDPLISKAFIPKAVKPSTVVEQPWWIAVPVVILVAAVVVLVLVGRRRRRA